MTLPLKWEDSEVKRVDDLNWDFLEKPSKHLGHPKKIWLEGGKNSISPAFFVVFEGLL